MYIALYVCHTKNAIIQVIMISFVYFDLGGVVEKDFSSTNKWEDLCDELQIDVAYRNVFEDFWRQGERENCTTRDVDTMLPVLQEKFGAKPPKNYSLLHAFVSRFEKNESIWTLLRTIHKTTRIGLLTNQYPHMFDAIEKAGILPPITWDVIVDSSKVGLIKPDKEIFMLAEEKANAHGQEILFVDNSRWNTDGAKAFGWQTFLYDTRDYDTASKDLAIFWQSLQLAK